MKSLFIILLSLQISFTFALNIQKRQRNGKAVGSYKYPYVAKLLLSTFEAPIIDIIASTDHCTATILSSKVVLTTAHCFKPWEDDEWYNINKIRTAKLAIRIDTGRISLAEKALHAASLKGDPYEKMVEFKVGDVFIHPDHSPDKMGRMDMDLAVIYLTGENELTFMNEDQFIRMPNETERAERHQIAESIGFGELCTGSCETVEHYTGRVPYVSEVEILDNENPTIEAGGPKGNIPLYGILGGDSGGPLICHEVQYFNTYTNGTRVPNKETFLCGIASYMSQGRSYYINVARAPVRNFINKFLAVDVVTPVPPYLVERTTRLSGAKARVGIGLNVDKRVADPFITDFFDDYEM